MPCCRLFCFTCLLVLVLASSGAVAAQTAPAASGSHTVACKALREAETPAELRYEQSAFKEAEPIFASEITAAPSDLPLKAAQIRNLLAEGDVTRASPLVDSLLATTSGSAVAKGIKAEMLLRMGSLPAAYALAAEAQKQDPCVPHVYATLAAYEDMIALHATAKRHIDLAHALAPADAGITREWIRHLPAVQKWAAWKDFADTSPALTEVQRKGLHEYIAYNNKGDHKAGCRAMPITHPLSIPFVPNRFSPNDSPLYALDVSLNGKARRLQLDTGASGITLTSGAADRLGLATERKVAVSGVSSSAVEARVAHVEKVQIGGLEFTDCEVTVLPPRDAMVVSRGWSIGAFYNIDGLIGGDVFQQFVLTLDYPGAQVSVRPLPVPGNEGQLASQTGGDTAPSADLDTTPIDRHRSPEMQNWTQFFRVRHEILVPTQLNDGPVKLLMVDTGAESNVIDSKAARLVTLVHEDSRFALQGVSGATQKNYLTDKLVLHFAGLYLPLPWMISVPTDHISNSDSVEVSGFLGFAALKQMTLEIDYRDNLIHFSFDPKRRTDPRFLPVGSR